jgi:hypothetical protein
MLTRLLRWLFIEPRHFWLALAVPSLTIFYSLVIVRTEPAIRLSGLTLQLLGILTAVWGIVGTWRYFELGDPITVLTSWLRRCPLRKPRVIIGVVGMATEQNDSLAVRGHTWWQPKPEAPIEERVAILEKNISLLSERISGVQREVDAVVQRLQQEVAEAARTAKTEAKQVSGRLKEFGTGSLHVSAIGAFWLFVGSILSSASQEILGFLR